VQFFKNHALLHHSGQHQWYTVEGGSIQYVSRLETRLRAVGVDVRLKAPIDAVRRKINSAEVKSRGGNWESFDEVIFATHSDDTLRLLSDASAEERDVLGAIKYQPNDVVLHCDEALMPKRRKVWSSWVYTEDASGPSDRIDLSYWMNSLQPIPENDPHFVTLNTKRTIREDKIYHQATFRHPVYDLAALEAQDKAKAMNGSRNTWFCGAWMKNGFHEDGLSSAVDVVEGIEHSAALKVAAE
jgi:predicted NAD/FAD-binding protein